jgi:2-C-methyl-D-erythritol 4-phosphate cytidylyltransferase
VPNTWAIVVAAGSGQRFGRPKQFERIAGRMLVEWSVEAARSSCEGVVVVVPASGTSEVIAADAVVRGGASRSESVRAGLAQIPASADVVIVHDAARPGASPGLFRSVASAVRAGAQAAIPGLAVADTLKRVDRSVDPAVVTETVDRESIVAVQTPQAFDAAALRAAHAQLGDATDDAGLIEADGGRVVVIPGEMLAMKVTTVEDLATLTALLAQQQDGLSR